MSCFLSASRVNSKYNILTHCYDQPSCRRGRDTKPRAHNLHTTVTNALAKQGHRLCRQLTDYCTGWLDPWMAWDGCCRCAGRLGWRLDCQRQSRLCPPQTPCVLASAGQCSAHTAASQRCSGRRSGRGQRKLWCPRTTMSWAPVCQSGVPKLPLQSKNTDLFVHHTREIENQIPQHQPAAATQPSPWPEMHTKNKIFSDFPESNRDESLLLVANFNKFTASNTQ
jgi:hypothetical protein